MIGIVNVHCSFNGIPALKGVSLNVEAGVMMGIIGPGGSGKSTLCKVVAGLVRPEGGVVFVDGQDMMKALPSEIQKVQSKLGVQFQNDALFEHMTVLENVEYPLKRRTSLTGSEIRYRAMERLAMVGLAGLENRAPNQLSGGQRRRTALARACVSDPKLLICDDPTAGLDPLTSRRILDMIVGIHYQAGNTVIIVSSDVVGLLSVVRKTALLWDGISIAEGPPAQFWRDERRRVKRFLDDAKLPSMIVQPSWGTKWDS
jgi:phospholipid/cholesterol/gamma-HCH transport system ATP-binding protein